jgi:ankyrin repeat protein
VTAIILVPVGWVVAYARSNPFGPVVCENSDDDLVRAAADGDAEDVRAQLAAGSDPRAATMGRTPMACAAANGRLDVVEVLLDAGVDPDDHPQGSDPPVWLAARDGRGPVVAALLDAGADPATSTSTGPALLAAVAGRSESDETFLFSDRTTADLGVPAQEPLTSPARRRAVEALLAAGADPDGVGGSPTPLVTACHLGAFDLVEALLAGGADPNRASVVSGSALDEVLQRSAGPTGTVAPPGTAVEITPAFGYELPPLFAAAARGDAPIVTRLLAAGADPNAVALGGYRPLHAAALADDAATVEALVAAGATAGEPGTVPSPLEIARTYGHQHAADALSR